MKRLEDMDLIDDFLNNALANSTEYAEEAYRIILEALLGFSIGEISIINQRTFASPHPDMRGIRLDVEITERDKYGQKIRMYDYEPHAENDLDFPKHNRFYQAKIDNKNMKSGDDDFAHMPELYVITITNFDIWGYDYMLYTFENSCREVPEIKYGDGLHFLYFNTKGSKGGSESIKNMLSYIQTSRDINVVDNSTRKLDELIDRVKDLEEVRSGYMTLGHLIDRETREAKVKAREEGLEEGREQGLAEGREQGLEEGRVQGLEEGREQGREQGHEDGQLQEREKNIMAMFRNGLSAELISKYLELDINVVNSVLDKMTVMTH